MISAGDVLIYGSVIAIDVYVFWTLYRANRSIDYSRGVMDQIKGFFDRFKEPKTMIKTVRLIFAPEIKKLHDTIDGFGIYKDPRVVQAIAENTIIDFFGHIGAKNLKEMGVKQKDINRIVMARNGIKSAGHLMAEGAGVNEIVKNVGGMIPKGMPQGQDGEIDIMSVIMQYFMGNIMGGGGSSAKGGGGGGTIG